MKSDPAAKNEFNSSNESLEKYGIDLTQSARDGILDPVIGRDEEIRRTIQILSRKGWLKELLMAMYLLRYKIGN